MVENRSIIDQFHELQSMYANMKIRYIQMDEVFIVSSIINKLSPSWRDVRHALQYKKEEITLSDLRQHIVVESSIRAHESQKNGNPNVATINMVEDKGRSSSFEEKEKKNHLSRGSPTLPHRPLTMDIGSVENQDTGKRIAMFLRTRKKKAKGQTSTSKDPLTKGDYVMLKFCFEFFFNE